jgi:hypothetical protein
MHYRLPPARRFFSLLTVGALGIMALLGATAFAADDTATKGSYSSRKETKPLAELMAPEAWRKAAWTKLQPKDIDRLISQALQQDKIAPAPLTTDEQFIRRVTLDLTGELPAPAEVEEFVKSKDPQKRAKLIDRLLDSEEYAKHWGKYWRDVTVARSTVVQVFIRFARTAALETWLSEQFRANRSWGAIARDMITAEGELQLGDDAKQGPAAFLLGAIGPDAINERTAETSRLFLGIQIQCAQCHDHPSDVWKRNQFHELAAFYGRTRERILRTGGMGRGVALTSAPGGEHRMPNLNEPGKSTPMNPRFLDGRAIQTGLGDKERRQALADFITSKDNYWFSAAFVNRIWGELMGQAFYQPVDDMGPSKEATLPEVLTQLAASFRADDYNIKDLFRTVLNSQTYQRQIRLGESLDQHMHFAAAYPMRLRADALWQSLVNAVGTPKGPDLAARRPPAAQAAAVGNLQRRLQTFENIFKREFSFDPSLKPDDVEGTIPQALMLMNNAAIAERIQAKDETLLARILKSHIHDADALRALYLKTLARKPTDRELVKCQKYIAKVGSRSEAFEDLLWALINSTEFQTKR